MRCSPPMIKDLGRYTNKNYFVLVIFTCSCAMKELREQKHKELCNV